MSTVTSTTSTGATQSLVQALGAGSGVDMQALATNLATAQFASRIDRITAKSEKLTAQVSSASNIKSMLLAFSTSLGTLVRTGNLSPQPQVANSAVASASLSGSRRPSGTFSLEVKALATGQTLATPTFAADETIGGGTLKLRFGTAAGGAFTADGTRSAIDIAVPADAKLADVAIAINARNAGVSAYVATTPQGTQQLVLKGPEGAANGFELEASEVPADSKLSSLAWSHGSGTGQLLSSAANASFLVDGLERSAPSNTVSEAIPGVTLKLGATNVGAPTKVTFADTSAAISSAMTDLVGALNEVAAALNTATDANTGDLRSDSGARALKTRMSQLAGTAIMPSATGAAKTLADLGVSTQRDGTFVLDQARLAATIAKDPDGVSAMFTNGLNGVYATVDKLYRDSTSASDPGSLGGSITRFNKQLQQVSEDKATLAEKQETLRASLSGRFAVADTRVQQSQSTLAFLQNQINAWNKSGD
jgi:flagellar hook-associated protein 2